MNIFVLFVLIIWTIIWLLTLLLAQIITITAPEVVAYSMPLSCVPVGETTSVCYTCVNRRNMYLLPFHSIEIESDYRFNFVKFKYKTGLFCDELAQMIDISKYGETETFIFSHLQPIYKVLNDKKGAGSRISTQSIIISPGQYEIVIFHKMANQQLGNIHIETKMLSSNIYRRFLVTVKILSLISFVSIMILELVKYWHQIDNEWSFLLGMMVLLAYSICFIRDIDFDLKTMTYAWIVCLFVFALIVQGIDKKAMLILLFLVPWFNQDDKKIYAFAILVLLLFYYILQIDRTKLNLKSVISATAFALFLINRALIIFCLHEWQSLKSFIFQSLIILLTPLIISTTAFLNFSQANRPKYEEMTVINGQQSIT